MPPITIITLKCEIVSCFLLFYTSDSGRPKDSKNTTSWTWSIRIVCQPNNLRLFHWGKRNYIQKTRTSLLQNKGAVTF